MDIIQALQACEREDPLGGGKNEPDSIYGLAAAEIKALRRIVAEFVAASEPIDPARLLSARDKAARLQAR